MTNEGDAEIRSNVAAYFAPCPDIRNFTAWRRHGFPLTEDNHAWLQRKDAAKGFLKDLASSHPVSVSDEPEN